MIYSNICEFYDLTYVKNNTNLIALSHPVHQIHIMFTWSDSDLCSERVPYMQTCFLMLLRCATAHFNSAGAAGSFISQRHAIVKLILEREGLDQDDVKNYRPISNLTYISKLVERMVSKQLTTFLEEHSLLPKHQSGFRVCHSTETALLKVFFGHPVCCGSWRCDPSWITRYLLPLTRWITTYSSIVSKSLFVCLDRSSTSCLPFCMVEHIKSSWMGLHQRLRMSLPAFLKVVCSVLASEHSLGSHCYADTGQLYVFGKANDADQHVREVTECISLIDAWMSSNRIKLNSNKTPFIWLGGQQQLLKVGIYSVTLLGDTVIFQSSENDLGVTIDDPLSMRDQWSRPENLPYIIQPASPAPIRGSLSIDACTMLVHAFVSNRLDYCNYSLLAGISDELVNKLQSVLRSGARLILRKRKFDPISRTICVDAYTGSPLNNESSIYLFLIRWWAHNNEHST